VRTRGRKPFVAAWLALALVGVTACGSRLSAQDRALAIQRGAGGTGGGTATGAGTTGAATGSGATTGSTGSTTGFGGGATAGGSTATGGTTSGSAATGSTGSTGATSGSSATGTTGTTADSCAATSKNNGGSTDVGVTSTEIKVGNISDITGPVAGLFKSAEQAYYAFIQYFNQTHPAGICGRKLVADTADDGTDSGINRSKTQDACHADFAIVGSQSAFDDGGAEPAHACGIVDMPAAAVTGARQANPTTHAANSTNMHYLSDAVPTYFKSAKFGAATKHAAFLYIDEGAAKENASQDIKAFAKAGFKWVYTAGLPVQSATTQGFAPYVQKLKDKGVQFVEWLGAYQEAASLAQAMSNASFKPKAYLLDPTGYNPGYISQAGSSATGTYIYDNAAPLSDVNSNAELKLYASALQASGVSDPPTYFGQFAWSAMRLFTELAFKVGPKLTRKKMNALLAKANSWTDLGMHAPQQVGSKITGKCFNVLQVQGNDFRQVYPARQYACGRLIHV
jgi:hypothetical protein